MDVADSKSRRNKGVEKGGRIVNQPHNHKFVTARATGIVLIVALLVGFVWANSPWQESYRTLHDLPVHIRVGPFQVNRPLIWWINEGLMVFFFLLVGLQIKREIISGQLSSWKKVTVPAVAALAGMMVPAAIYLATVGPDEVLRAGWAIPTATDIVLVLGLLAFLGERVPVALKLFLAALAIFDDMGAVLIIGLFYGHGFELAPLLLAGGAMVLMALLTRFGRFGFVPLIVVGLVVWTASLQAGIEGAIAGIAISVLIPHKWTKALRHSPLVRLEDALKPWVFWIIVPAFALFNTGINVSQLDIADLLQPASIGIILALFAGKPIGIVGAVFVLDRLGVSVRTRELNWRQLIGASVLAGVGFTMSVFIASIAFDDATLIASSKLAILIASMCASVAGLVILAWKPRARERRFRAPTS
tara:strand:- start:162 stop:1412 length:1251 start_codon:yes stop_codon:yes gene_type:complete